MIKYGAMEKKKEITQEMSLITQMFLLDSNEIVMRNGELMEILSLLILKGFQSPEISHLFYNFRRSQQYLKLWPIFQSAIKNEKF